MVIQVSKPTRQQVIHSLERVLLVFVVSSVGYWVKTPNPYSKAALLGATLAGITACYQAAISLVTTL